MSKTFFGVVFSTSAIISFNAMLWQISRRNEKAQVLKNHENLKNKPLKDLPPAGASTNDWEFHPILLQGSFDNEGSVLVGPRHFQSYKGTQIENEKRGGFAVMTPFEIANSGGKFVMVNRGWVPIDAGKHRIMLAQYIGEGFQPATIRGILRKEEFSKDFIGRMSQENFQPLAANLSWFVMRPYDIALEYYGKRWGKDKIPEMKAQHGAHHFMLEMIEDFSGTDQRLVRGVAYPKRRELDEITYVHLAPMIHSMYVMFWGFACVLSIYCARKGFVHQKAVIKKTKKLQSSTGEYEKVLQQEALKYYEQMKTQDGGAVAAATAAATVGTSQAATSTPPPPQSQQSQDVPKA